MSFLQFQKIKDLLSINGSQLSDTDDFVVSTNDGTRKVSLLDLLTKFASNIPLPIASTTQRGVVKINSASADPTIYLKSEVDTALSGKSDTNHTHSNSTTSTSGFLSSTDKSKLDGISIGATANSTDAELRDRSTHTGTQSIASVSGLQTALNSKADLTGATFTGAIQIPSAVVTSGSSGVTLWHGGDSATPVVLNTYSSTGSERGLSVPQLRCTNGRIDIQPLSGAAEFRITGASTQLRFWNSTNANSYLTINSDRTVNLFNTLNSAGRIVVADTTASTSTTTGSATFAGGVGVAGTVNANRARVTDLTVAPTSNGTIQSWLNTSGSTAAYVDSFGNMIASGIVQGGAIQTGGSVTATQFKLSALNSTPSSASATGTTGEIRFDANYIYLCTATNIWKRAALTTW